MQPCAVCAGVAVDVDGYCVSCGTFRGTRAGGTPAGPTSAPAGPTGPPHGPPGPEPGSPRRPRSPFLVPLIALSATLVVLVAAIVVVGLLRSDHQNEAFPGPTLSVRLDPCVVGTWRVSSHEEQVPIARVGTVKFTGKGARMTLRADGTGVTEHGTGTRYGGTANGRDIVLTVTGTVTFRFETTGDTMSFADVKADGQGIVTVDGQELGRQPFKGGDSPARYTCGRARLVERTDAYEVTLTRES